MAWIWLTIAILLEVAGTVCLRLSAGFERWLPATAALALYAASLALLSKALHRIEAGVVTAAWSGLGILLMNVIGAWWWEEALTGKKIGFLALVLIGVVGLATASPLSQSAGDPPYSSWLDHLVANHPHIFSAALLVRSPAVSFVGAAGEARPGEAMTPQHRFRIASMSKTFTATVALQLVEEGKLTLDGRVADQLPHYPYARFDRLLGDDYGPQITVRQLLTHTSGLADYISYERFVAFVMNHPQTQWSPALIFEKYYEYKLNQDVRFAPGQGVYYSDTNYVLLGLLIEHVTGKSLAHNYRTRILNPLAMDNTFLEFYEVPRGNTPVSYPYHDTLLTDEINTSFDWGGGGLVSTVAEVDRFLRALLHGQLFQKQATLDTLLSFQPEADTRFSLGLPFSEYGTGIRRLRFENHTWVGHSGSWGCVMYYNVERDVSVVVTVNQDNGDEALNRFFQQVILSI